MNSSLIEKLTGLEPHLASKIKGQGHVITRVCSVLERGQLGLQPPGKPLGSLLLLGPTGVGKTELTLECARYLFGSDGVFRFDMSEFLHLDAVKLFMGDESGAPGRLGKILSEHRQGILLFDEIEKAHTKVINLFLQVLDDARLTDLNGKTADFANTIIIATTNAKNLKKAFSPEWLNRFSAIITFARLSPVQIEAVIKLKLKLLQQTLAKQEIKLEFAPPVAKILAKAAFSDEWGGRQADRIIQNQVESVVAEKILKNEIVKNQPYLFSL